MIFHTIMDVILLFQMKKFNSFFSKKMNLKKKLNLFFVNNNQISHLIITRGDKDVIYSDKRKISLLKVKKIKPKDVTGASDTFISILGILKKKYSLKAAIIQSYCSVKNCYKEKFVLTYKKKNFKWIK